MATVFNFLQPALSRGFAQRRAAFWCVLRGRKKAGEGPPSSLVDADFRGRRRRSTGSDVAKTREWPLCRSEKSGDGRGDVPLETKTFLLLFSDFLFSWGFSTFEGVP